MTHLQGEAIPLISVTLSMAPLAFSVVMPTFNRRDVVVASILALERQRFRKGFEVIVVVDGSTDGTADRLRSVAVSFPLTILEQPNSGAAVARNRGARAARGEILLFLDDDMEADAELLAAHLQCHQEGADIVVGHIPLHADSPQGILRQGVAIWADDRLARLTAAGATPSIHDVLTGQLSIRRERFDALGGFDTAFTRNGSFGKEDVDFGYRAQKLGFRIVFNAAAVSRQRYVVRPDQYLRQRRDAGRADVVFARKHPDRVNEIFSAIGGGAILRPMASIPVVGDLTARMLRRSALWCVGRQPPSRLARRIFGKACAAQYWSGVREAGGIPSPDPPCILAYHSIRELPSDSPLAPYTVSPRLFKVQIETLLAAGTHFVDADAILGYVNGHGSLPPRAVMLTFDDCYVDLLDTALPILRARKIPAVAFAVSGRIGGVNSWDRHLGAPELRLLNADGLRNLASAGVEIGAHSHSHRALPRVPPHELSAELEGCASIIESLGLPRPRLFAYPYGQVDERVATAVEKSGFSAALTVRAARLSPGMNRLLLPRIGVYSSDVGAEFARRVSGARFLARLRRDVRTLERDLRHGWTT